ncbi:MAG: hypothetical protein Q8T08_04450 [Ignavibacteria bacterium]|nr:hypothetical protein [Ignavibacteria bacterium]
MKGFCTKPILVWICIILFNFCQTKSNELVKFQVSDGVMNNMDFSPLGFQNGQKPENIELHDLKGKTFHLKPSKNRPLLLITGSYTCDVTRGNLPAINAMYEKYKDVADIYLVNTQEAHPQSSQSPYSAEPEPWHALDNITAGISAEQPRTLEERKELAERWISEQGISTPVLLDGPNNEFWTQAGQAPNMSILISGEGEVVLKQDWFEEKALEEALVGEL